MRLFISYARVDKRYCEQIVELLNIYDVWYDQRLHVGQKWWDEIVHRLEWTDGFVYLMSPESLESDYCQKELEIARNLGKYIFPVQIHPRINIPAELGEYQIADLSQGLDAKSAKELLGAIYLSSKQRSPPPVDKNSTFPIPRVLLDVSAADQTNTLEKAAHALDREQFDQAVFLLKQLVDQGFMSRFIDVQNMLEEAEIALEMQARRRDAEREYEPIRVLLQHERTYEMGARAFAAFREVYPDYDPDGLASLTGTEVTPNSVLEEDPLATIEWCPVEAGEVVLQHRNGNESLQFVNAFHMSKYPVTNAQFALFLAVDDGYHNPVWWRFSDEAVAWREANPHPLPVNAPGDDYPRHNICWYEAVAYTRWLSHQTGLDIRLPGEQEWQWAAQGSLAPAFPWGDQFESHLCNTKESGQRGPTPVHQYPAGASVFGLCDMAGNVWEWCQNGYRGKRNGIRDEILRVVRGGSFMTSHERARNTARLGLKPVYRYASIGFRLVCDCVV